MNRTEAAIAAYLSGDLIGVRAAFGVAGERDGIYALDTDDSDPASERTFYAASEEPATIVRGV